MTAKNWCIVPVPAETALLPRRFARRLGDRPLILHSLEKLSGIIDPARIVLCTHDNEIASLAAGAGLRNRVDPGLEASDAAVIGAASAWLRQQGAKEKDVVLIVHPAFPFLSEESIRKCLKMAESGEGVQTAAAVLQDIVYAVPDHAARPVAKSPGNPFRMVDALRGSLFGVLNDDRPVKLIELTAREAIEVKDYADLAAADYHVLQKKILIRADSGSTMGMGHVYRALAVALELGRFQPRLVTMDSAEKALGKPFFERQPFETIAVRSDDDFVKLVKKDAPDLIILDQLNTDAAYVSALKKTGARVVTFEDNGTGAGVADLLVSDLYKNPDVPDDRQLSGVEHTILAPSFGIISPKENVAAKVENVLVLFGGTDPAGLTEKTLQALKDSNYAGHVTVVQGLGRKDRKISLSAFGLKGEVLTDVKFMPELMRNADLAFSSAGRTITELMYAGTPTLCLCQNEKELTHTHASQAYGVLNLGLGELTGGETLVNNIRFLLGNAEFRRHMHSRARNAMRGHSNSAVIGKMLSRLRMEICL